MLISSSIDKWRSGVALGSVLPARIFASIAPLTLFCAPRIVCASIFCALSSDRAHTRMNARSRAIATSVARHRHLNNRIFLLRSSYKHGSTTWFIKRAICDQTMRNNIDGSDMV